ncbi:MAG: matrixin family metalloprotease [Proteobacteria bacterium]|jgi:hypothetical protein|nr:matrixin family metalloprotease [Pseudomonadota bacterium]
MRTAMLILLAALLAFAAGCSSSSGGGGGTDTDVDTDSDTDSDTDVDTDSDTDTDTDTDADGGVECDGNEDCDDDNLCTDDLCDDGSCVHDDNTEPCDDDNECTLDDACLSGLCQGGDPLICNDGDVCTDDSCDPAAGCAYVNNTAACDDGQYCSTDDQCQDGVCAGAGTFDCDDDNPCTTDSCDDVFGCQWVNNTAGCDDGDLCTVGDVCGGGTCQAGAGALDCNDLDVCTDDSCHPTAGCQHAFNTVPCTDGDACTMDDACYAGDCVGAPLDADDDGHVSDACAGGDDCDDDDELVNPAAFEGPLGDAVCSDTLDNDCDDLTDAADPQCGLCVTAEDCDDGNVCNGAEGCGAGGICTPGTLLDCDDDNICTTNSCDPTDGCAWANNTAPCDDGDACTLGDHCAAGSCSEHTSTLTCDDFELCTDDSCVPATGCVFAPNTLACDDGDACTLGDQCHEGGCVGGTLVDADGDGYGSGDGCPGNDCDDGDETVHPGADELCDGIDNDCNWLVDEGCPECDTVDAEDELRIDNDFPLSGYLLAAGDEVYNIFFVDAEAYNLQQIQVGFYDFCPDGETCTGNGDYSVHVYADEDGLPGAELASTPAFTVATQWTDLYTFPLTAPLALIKDQLFWVGVRSLDDQTANYFLPLVDGGVLVPYFGGALYSTADTTYYGTMGNWVIRGEGCAEGPWLGLTSHTDSLAVLPAGGTVTTTGTLRNRGPENTADAVVGTLSSGEDRLTVTAGANSFGVINAGASATGTPSFSIAADAAAFGIYPVILDSSDGPNSWLDAWGIYVQGDGCDDENYQLVVDNDTPTYFIPAAAGDELGQYYVVDATGFTLTSAEAQFYRNSGPVNAQFRLKIYTYRAGYPDKAIYTASSWTTVSGTGVIPVTFTLPTPLTFKLGDTFWATIEFQDDLSADEFGLLTDDGDYATTTWFNGVFWEEATSTWSPMYLSYLLRMNGCRSTELVYDAHTSAPSPIPAGAAATLSITIANVGGVDATGVTGVLSSSDPDVTVTQADGTFGDVAADGGTATAGGFAVNVGAAADEFQYLLDLALTDGVTTWNTVVPLQLQGGTLNLVALNLVTTLVGSDVRFSFEVANTGNIDCYTDFDIDLYHDLDAVPTAGLPGDWSTTRSFLGAGDTISYVAWLEGAPPSNYNSYVQIDTYGEVSESNEADNVAGPANLPIGDADVFALLSPARKWFPADMPVEYRFVTANAEDSMVDPTELTAVQLGFQHWQDVPTASITFTQIANAAAGGGGFNNDGFNTMSFEDPDGDLGTGVLGACLPIFGSQTMITNGTTFRRMTDADIVFNNNVLFCTDAEAASPSCSGEFDLEGIATHEIGHLVGLDHPDVYEATMYWSTGPCNEAQTTLATSDINGVTFIYP